MVDYSMRLSEIRKIILENIDQLTYNAEAPNNNNGLTTVNNIATTVDAIEKISKLTFLTPSVNKLRGFSTVYNARTPSIAVPTGESENFKRALIDFREQCNNIITLANEVTPPIEEETISIKLLESANISDVKKLIVSLDEITSQTSNLPNIDGHVRFAGFESGTDWIVLSVTGAALAKFLNLIIEGAYSIANCYIAIKTAKQKCSSIEKIDQGLGDVGLVLKALCQSEVEKINNDNNYKFDPDNIIRVSNVMKGMVGVIADGNTVVPSLNAPTETQNKIGTYNNCITSQLQDLNLLASSEGTSDQASAKVEPID